MATTSITEKMRKEITEDISRLMGRGLKALPCPINNIDQAKFWQNTLPQHEVQAYELLKDSGYEGARSLCNWKLNIRTRFDQEYSIDFVSGTAIFLAKNRANAPHFIYADTLQRCYPGEHWEGFVSWVQNNAQIRREFFPSIRTVTEILKFCGTIGQLVRAVPDLYKYLPTEKARLLKDQSRSSNMPYEWASFDRTRVDALQFAMAKASLLPAQNELWENINVTGASYAS